MYIVTRLFIVKPLKNRKKVKMISNVSNGDKPYIEYKVAEYPERTDKGLAWVVIFKRIYL